MKSQKERGEERQRAYLKNNRKISKSEKRNEHPDPWSSNRWSIQEYWLSKRKFHRETAIKSLKVRQRDFWGKKKKHQKITCSHTGDSSYGYQELSKNKHYKQKKMGWYMQCAERNQSTNRECARLQNVQKRSMKTSLDKPKLKECFIITSPALQEFL